MSLLLTRRPAIELPVALRHRPLGLPVSAFNGVPATSGLIGNELAPPVPVVLPPRPILTRLGVIEETPRAVYCAYCHNHRLGDVTRRTHSAGRQAWIVFIAYGKIGLHYQISGNGRGSWVVCAAHLCKYDHYTFISKTGVIQSENWNGKKEST